jgi:hypothetical protein
MAKLKTVLGVLLIVFSASVFGEDTKYKPGAEVVIKDYFRLYPMLYDSDCIQFPSEEIKIKSNPETWPEGTFRNGQAVKVVSSSPHCRRGDETVYIIESQGHYAPISEKGIDKK